MSTSTESASTVGLVDERREEDYLRISDKARSGWRRSVLSAISTGRHCTLSWRRHSTWSCTSVAVGTVGGG